MHRSNRSNRNAGKNADLLGIVREELAKGWSQLGFRNSCTHDGFDFNREMVCDNLRRVAGRVINILPKEDPWLSGQNAWSIRNQLWPKTNRINGINPITLCAAQWVTGPDGEFPATLEGLRNLVTWIKKELMPRGCQGMEAVMWQHKDPLQILEDDDYRDRVVEIHKDLPRVDVISNHLFGQGVCDPIRRKHKALLGDAVWGDGFPFGVNFRAGVMYMLSPVISKRLYLNDVTHGFTGSAGLWQIAYDFARGDDDIELGLKFLNRES